MKRVVQAVVSTAVVWAIYSLRANVWFRLYPVMVVVCVLCAFAASLFRTPLVEVFARRMGERLDGRGVAYCRNVTRAWVAFLTVHLAVTVATVFMSYEAWALYNGCIAYVLMGLMFAGEWIVRRRVRRA